MNFALFIAKRYLFSKNKTNAINIISTIAGLGVIVGSAALFVVLSGFAGLRDFSLQFSSIVDPDLKITALKGKFFTFSQDELDRLEEIPGIVSYSKLIEERVVLNYDNKNEIVTLKGVDSNYPKATIDSILSYGRWMDEDLNQIVSGWGVSGRLSFSVFDFGTPIKLYVPKPGKGQITSIKGAYNVISVYNSGIFQINEDLDNSVVYCNIDTARQLLDYQNNEITALELLTNGDTEAIREELESVFNGQFVIKTRAELNDALYKMLNTENLIVYLVFTLILIIALFNIIGSMIMIILDKKHNISTLYNLGASIKDIRRVFFLQGGLMSIVGGLIGVGIGYLLILHQLYGFENLKAMITPSLPYPAKLEVSNFIIVILTISVLGVIASKIASSRVSKALLERN